MKKKHSTSMDRWAESWLESVDIQKEHLLEPHFLKSTELAVLPRWAIVAFAARCTRLALPFFSGLTGEEDGFFRACNTLVEFTEDCATNSCDLLQTNAEQRELLRKVEDEESRIMTLVMELGDVDDQVTQNRMTVASVAKAATGTANAIRMTDKLTLAKEVSEVVWHTTGFSRVSEQRILQEFELLREVACRESWTDQTGVHPTFFSPDCLIERQVIFAINDLSVKLCELIAENGKALYAIEWRLIERTVA